MPEFIRDGKGTGYLVGVTDDNRMLTSTVSRSKEHHANIVHGEAFNWNIDVTPTGADDCFVYVKNTGTQDLILEGFTAFVDANEIVKGYFNDTGTPVGGTDCVPANLNAGSAKTPAATFYCGNDITGLTKGSFVGTYYLPATNSSNHVNFEADLVIPPQSIFTAYAQTGGINIVGHITFWIEREVS